MLPIVLIILICCCGVAMCGANRKPQVVIVQGGYAPQQLAGGHATLSPLVQAKV